jgi:hypothetical protein
MPVFADALPMPSDLPINSIDPTSLSTIWMTWWMSTAQMVYYWIIWLFSIICMWIIFKKAWRKWRESIIPVWNTYVLCKIIWKKKRFWIFISPVIIWLLRLIVSLIFWAIWGGWQLWMVIKNTINWILWIASLISLILCIVYGIISYFRLAKKFGKSWGFGVWLLFLTPIFLWILAFGKAKYQWGE